MAIQDVADAAVEQYCPECEDAIKEQAATMMAKYLKDNHAVVMKQRSAPPGVLEKSGAKSLLDIFRSKRARIVGI